MIIVLLFSIDNPRHSKMKGFCVCVTFMSSIEKIFPKHRGVLEYAGIGFTRMLYS
jgi:hypothetical protein